VLASVECHRHSGIEGEPFELLAEPQRGRKAERPALAVVQPIGATACTTTPPAGVR
jgi:hypothetical protein